MKMRGKRIENLTDQFIRILERIPFKDTILMMDGGILCSEIFLKALDMGFTVIGRLNPVMNVIFQGRKLHLSKLRGKTSGLSSVEKMVFIASLQQTS
jgi:hypothetical protein